MEDILDDFFVFLVAGMETTAITMSTLMWLLLKHPDISQKVVNEVLIQVARPFLNNISNFPDNPKREFNRVNSENSIPKSLFISGK